MPRFDRVNTQVLGISVDSIPCLQAWSENLGKITFPLLSDFYPHGKIAQKYGILRPEGFSERAIFIIDRAGYIRYIDIHNMDDQPDNEILFSVLAKIEGIPIPSLDKEYKSIEKNEDNKSYSLEATPNVNLYCTDWCPSCKRARAYLKQHNIMFNEINIEKDRVAAERVRRWANGNETTPTFEIDGEIVVNFLRARLNQLLGINE